MDASCAIDKDDDSLVVVKPCFVVFFVAAMDVTRLGLDWEAAAIDLSDTESNEDSVSGWETRLQLTRPAEEQNDRLGGLGFDWPDDF